jgi:hypothetical protein
MGDKEVVWEEEEVGVVGSGMRIEKKGGGIELRCGKYYTECKLPDRLKDILRSS